MAGLISPAAGKGMNLASQDGIELTHELIERFGPRQDDMRAGQRIGDHG